MSAKNKVAGICLALMAGVPSAQTIDEIVELNRQALLAEAKGKLEAAKKSGNGAAPQSPSGSGNPSALPLPPGPPAAAAPAWRMVPAKKGPSSPPALIAIYGVGGSLMAELNDGGIEAKYKEGDKTPGGWTVSRIDKRNVDLTRPPRSKRKNAKHEKVALAFGTKVEVPQEPVSASSSPMPGPSSYNMPPLPSSFPTSR